MMEASQMLGQLLPNQGLSIRRRQVRSIEEMLGDKEDWKVLIYDEVGQAILSPILNVQELRSRGVTVHLLLSRGNRDPIPDVPAVYFCEANEANMKMIAADVRDHKYESYSLNFVNSIPRILLEEFSEACVECGCAGQITKIYDMYCSFKCIEDDFFILSEGDDNHLSYLALNQQNASDEEMERVLESIVKSIFSVFVTLGSVPIIRCPKSSPISQMIATALDKKFRDHLRSKGHSLFADRVVMDESGSLQRPVLILLDRTMDVPTVLHHAWSYQALIHDIFGIKANRTTVEVKKEGGRTQVKKYEFDKRDLFWSGHKTKPFVEVIQEIQGELDACTAKEKQIKEKMDSGSENIAQGLASAIDSLPELSRQKGFLDMHLTILTQLVDVMKKRQHSKIYEIEEKVMNNSALEQSLREAICDADMGSTEDRLRLLIVGMLSDKISSADVDACEAALVEQGCSTSALHHIKALQQLQKVHKQPDPVGHKSKGALFDMAKTLWKDGMKMLVPTHSDLPATQIVDSITSGKKDDLTAGYLFFDPMKKATNGQAPPERRLQPVDQAIVFMVGGGNYTEYHNLVDYTASHPDKGILYGTTQLISPHEFVAQLTALGEELSSSSASSS